ncbi:MAG: hypothetical protein KatS3mg051_1521 [Anaerolineae bacterium]|nr:MAG: hypothetical protein KatS3mg051_1521 [Anaerolineae bacterium]
MINNPKLQKIYGSSYFGSGGGFGRVHLINATATGESDNGFVAGFGPDTVFTVPDSRRSSLIVATGGDSINGGRYWTEIFYRPQGGEWEAGYIGQEPAAFQAATALAAALEQPRSYLKHFSIIPGPGRSPAGFVAVVDTVTDSGRSQARVYGHHYSTVWEEALSK